MISQPFNNINDLNLYLSGNKIICLECGGAYKSLSHHLIKTHNISASKYKKKYNIPKSRCLMGRELINLKRVIMKAEWEKNDNFEQVRVRIKKDAKKNLKGVHAPRTSSLSCSHIKTIYEKKCPICKITFTRPSNKYKFCSQSCYEKSAEKKINSTKAGSKGGAINASQCKRDPSGKFIKSNQEKK